MGAALNAVRDAVDQATVILETAATQLAQQRLPSALWILRSAELSGGFRPVFDATFLDQLPDLSPPRILSARGGCSRSAA